MDCIFARGNLRNLSLPQPSRRARLNVPAADCMYFFPFNFKHSSDCMARLMHSIRVSRHLLMRLAHFVYRDACRNHPIEFLTYFSGASPCRQSIKQPTSKAISLWTTRKKYLKTSKQNRAKKRWLLFIPWPLKAPSDSSIYCRQRVRDVRVTSHRCCYTAPALRSAFNADFRPLETKPFLDIRIKTMRSSNP